MLYLRIEWIKRDRVPKQVLQPPGLDSRRPGMARVLRTSLVAPSPAGAALHERSLPLTYLDALWLHATPVERVFFYPDATSDVLSNLTDSLSNALAAFYPLAGRLRLTPGAHNRYELHYQPGDGVTFTVAEHHHVGFGELATDDPTEVAKIVPLVPPLPEGGAVLAVQATVLRGGLAIGVTVHHAACDGVSSTHFLRTWAWAAAACSGASAPEPPFVDRSIIRPRDDLYDAFTAPRLSSNDDGGKPPDLPVVQQLLAAFTLSKEHLQSIKAAVAGEAGCRGVPPPRATSIIAAFGFIWQCYVRAKPGTDGKAASSCGGRAYFLLPADHRTRLEPPVPDEYLGNCLGPCIASAPRRDVAAAGADGLFTACAAIATAIDGVVRDGAAYWDGWMERIIEAYSAGGFPQTVAGSPRFRVYDTDFGFGRPAKVDVVSAARTGSISVAEARGGGGSGVEVGISLPAGGMERFSECFADAIACL
ncbi:phenolic glucoside malonyltransferase 1-like [Aegilops tauschii subsp. strangulata]|uniref:Anthocyanin 5-aromatic acyltransferase n=1 Tax=Aegilops tauschii subsp. strangulata TaxID=200361 RepID=A0A453CXF5_AEGTS|nr:phenolic glucoside malonyltransferase 1-like [Aegilops tauschii subsp. strangulata]